MAGNVPIIIIPNQRKTVPAMLKSEAPNPIWGDQAKQRSIHNNYLTLLVVFTMLSNHDAFTYASPRWSWLILGCIFIASFLVRHWFNTTHTGAQPDWRPWPAAAVQASLLVRHAPPEIADAFCGSRFDRERSGVYGVLPRGADVQAILRRSVAGAV
jgi:uncharacterized membrane protein